MCRIEGWSVRTLRERIDSMLYERTALSKQPEALIRQELAILRSKGDVTPALVLKDPYVLDFLGLTDRFLERDLEDAILRELEIFLLELGAGFSFVARHRSRFIMRCGESSIQGTSPRPETFSEATTHRMNKGPVGMQSEQMLEPIHGNGGYNLKKVWVILDSREGYHIIKLIRWGSR